MSVGVPFKVKVSGAVKKSDWEPEACWQDPKPSQVAGEFMLHPVGRPLLAKVVPLTPTTNSFPVPEGTVVPSNVKLSIVKVVPLSVKVNETTFEPLVPVTVVALAWGAAETRAAAIRARIKSLRLVNRTTYTPSGGKVVTTTTSNAIGNGTRGAIRRAKSVYGNLLITSMLLM
jgi:hypothetical protein